MVNNNISGDGLTEPSAELQMILAAESQHLLVENAIQQLHGGPAAELPQQLFEDPHQQHQGIFQ